MHQQLQDYRPSIPDGGEEASQNFDKSLRTTYPMSIDNCQTIPEMDDSQLVGTPVTMLAADVDLATRESVNTVVPVDVSNDTKLAEINTGKRKRGRPPRIHGKLGPPLQPSPLASQRKKQDEEDVCFICFDGGSLVLCDRRGCPKAYHPACIKRDEAFFRSKAKWNCGWHICSSCQKASHYMCYTCPYSLCKGCTKDADYLCVRGNKGFCGTCMRTIMLIENITLGNQEMVQVDFDDKTSWEYLFKVYWIYLKGKLSLTVDELTKAKNPWKGEELPKARNYWRGAGAMASKQELSIESNHGNDNKASFSESGCGNLEAVHSKRRKMEEELKLRNENSPTTAKSTVGQVMGLPEGSAWATKELLEFVAHMKNGDISVLSQFDVQGLLLEYIKRNNLRDPHQKSQIVCDSRLINLFGGQCVGQFEMLKLLDHHFLVKSKSAADETAGMGVPDAVVGQAEASRNNDGQLMTRSDRKRKTCKKTDEKGEQITPNPKEYAAIDVHNINLLYLNRNLMENLMDDAGKLHEKVVGSFVRIRVSCGDQKQHLYRLVQVVGTSKVAETYKVGSRTTNVMLEILNLDKKEVISIDEISNQEFSEDECRRLRRSIKCGFIKRLTVGEIQEKALVLQAVKVTDWLEAEILRLNHLRDQASENGHKEELRECVEKLDLLKSPEERQRRLLETTNVHSDPNMNPSYESEEDAFESEKKKHGYRVRKINSGIGRKGAELNSSSRGCNMLNNIGDRSQDLATASERSGEICTTFYVDRDGTTMIHEKASESAESQGGEIGLNSQNAPKNWVGPTGSVTCDWNGQAVVQSGTFSGVSSPVLPPLSTGRELLVIDTETEKMWHYQDPSGKIQGPFPMAQLRKWSESGLFPCDLRVWKMNESQGDSILLTDALAGRFHKEPSLCRNSYLSAQEVMVASDRDKKLEFVLQRSPDASFVDGKNADHSWKSVQSDASVHYKGNDELISSNAWGSHSSSWTTAVDVTLPNNGQAQSFLQYGELLKGCKSPSDQSYMHSSLSSLPSSGKLYETPVVQVNEDHGDEKQSSGLSEVNENSHMTSEGQNNIGKSDEKRTDSESYSCQSQNWRPPSIKSSSSGLDSNSAFVSAAKSIKTSKRNEEIDYSDLPNPTPHQSNKDLKGQAAENGQSSSSKLPVLDSGPSWSTASSLVVGGAQLAEVAGEWSGYSPAPVKPLVEEWDSNHVSASSQRPTDGGGDHAATPTPESGQLTHSSPTDPVVDPSSWQSIVPEPTEFCSLVDESVSDLLAEVEAMESLGGLPSPTSKMRCDEELTRGSDDDCFRPVDGFSPAPDPAKSDAFSSTSDIQIPSQLTLVSEPLQLCHMPSQPSIIDQLFGMSPMPSQMTVAEESIQVSHTPPRSTSTDELFEEPLEISQRPSQSTASDEPLGLSVTDVPNPQKSFSGHSSTSPEADGKSKPNNVSVSRLKKHSEVQPPASSTGYQGESGSDIHPTTPSMVGQLEAGSDIQQPTPSNKNTRCEALKGNENASHGGAGQGTTNMVWGTGHGTAQQHARTNLATSTGNSGSWGSQPRYGGDRYSGPRDHRNHFQGSRDRDSGFGRDRSSWNKQPSYGAGNGGSSYRPPPKGQRLCKFYESGYCKKGASCSYLHPS